MGGRVELITNYKFTDSKTEQLAENQTGKAGKW